MAMLPAAPAFGPLLGSSFDRAFGLVTRSMILWGVVVVAALVLGAISFMSSLLVIGCFLAYWGFASLANTVREIDPSYRMDAGVVLSLIGLGIVIGLAVDIGLFLLIVPGIYIANKWSLAPLILVKERCGISDALTRSWNVTDRFFWPTLGFNILAGLAVFAVIAVGYAIFAGIMGALIFSRVGTGTAALTEPEPSFGGLFGVAIALGYCIYAFAIAYTYQAKDLAMLYWYDGLRRALGTT